MIKSSLKKILVPFFPIIDILIFPFTLLASVLLFGIRKMGISKMKVSKWVFKKVGVFPIVNHYYEPLFDETHLKAPLNKDRHLPGINWNDDAQLNLLNQFNYQPELAAIPYDKTDSPLQFYYGNRSLGPADAEYLYCMIRHFKPSAIIEIGSGYSTLITQQAIETNKSENAGYNCHHTCIEPYEMPWLEKTSAKIIRKLVEDIDLSVFKSMKENDILFIDSSHMIRPQGDVLFEFLEILPSLPAGVIIHVHDIFSPKDYTKKHIVEDVLFWNEQYLLEAFLSCNPNFEVIGALNYLKYHHAEEMASKLPIFRNHPQHEPGSFWMKKIKD